MQNERAFDYTEIHPPTLCQSRIFLLNQKGTQMIRKLSPYNLIKEFKTLQECEHVNIIKPICLESPRSYLMEYCEKGDINTGIPYQSTETIINDFSQMISAVSYLHRKQICHLDLKLANFVRNSEGKLKLIDFGHARSSLLPIRSVLGTPEYNSGERYKPHYDGTKADIFSLGICLTGLMVGYVPSSTTKQSFPTTSTFQKRPEYFWDVLESKTCKLSPEFPGLDSEAISLIESMVNPDPSLRPDIDTIQTHSFFNL